ncbi:MAG: hypothetical protein IJ859_00110 [Synergistaceae bacterium]|nr:hypothetical protein [Synergistaceae bacterium]
MSDSNNVDVRVATDATLATLAKDATLATIAKDATLSNVKTAIDNLVAAVENQGGGGGSGGGATISNSTVNITSGGNTITGGETKITGANLETKITGGTTHIYGGNFTVDGVPAVLASNIYDALDNSIFATVALAAQAHNAYYRENNLGEAPTAVQLAAIRAGTFKGLYPGDYWERSITYNNADGASVTDTVRMRIAHINYPRDGATPNIMVIPEYCLYNAKMEDSNTNANGYRGSKMYTTYLAAAIAVFKAFFGEENLLPYTIDLSTASGGSFVSTSGRIVDLLNQYQVFGTAGSYGKAADPEQTQLAIFKLNTELIKAKLKSVGSFTYWWTRDPYSSNLFAHVYPSGAASNLNASHSCGVRPAALIG